MNFSGSAVMNRIMYYIERFLSNGWACIGVATFVLVFAIFSRDEEHGMGSWFFIIISCILILVGLGDITGLGFHMSF